MNTTRPYHDDLGAATTVDLIRDQLAGMRLYLEGLLSERTGQRRATWRSAQLDVRRTELRGMLVTDMAGVITVPKRLVADTEHGAVYAVAAGFGPDLPAGGLMACPERADAPVAVVLAPAGIQPEDWFGLTDRLPLSQQLGRHLFASGWRVVCPRLFAPLPSPYSMGDYPSFGSPPTARDEIWRLATQLGLSYTGIELGGVLACLAASGVGAYHAVGIGDAGRLALLLAAIDERCAEVYAAGAFGDRADPRASFPWPELIHGWALHFGDAEVLALISPRHVTLVDRLDRMAGADYKEEIAAAEALGGVRPCCLVGEHAAEVTAQIVAGLGARQVVGPRLLVVLDGAAEGGADQQARDRHEQTCRRLRELLASAAERRERRSREDLGSRRAEWAALVGVYPEADAPLRARGRLAGAELQSDRIAAYEVCVPVYRDPAVFVRGLLAVPLDLAEGERRPVVMCSHGWEGTPELTHQPGIYNAFAGQLAERGYVTWAPQGYFRSEYTVQSLYRKASLIGLTEFGLMARLLGRSIDYLAALPFVEPARIGFYGLSYGGYTALWWNGLEPRLAAVVCSGHFNDWQAKTTGRNPASYLNTENASMYVPGILTRFNHGDLAALACPRPFLIESGDEDWVVRRDWVEREYERARGIYAAHGAQDRIELVWEQGGHQVFGRRSFEFLDRWLWLRN